MATFDILRAKTASDLVSESGQLSSGMPTSSARTMRRARPVLLVCGAVQGCQYSLFVREFRVLIAVGEVNSNLFKETNVEVTEQSQENTLLSRAK